MGIFSRLPRKPLPTWPIHFLIGLPCGALVFLALAARFDAFWLLSRWPRLFFFGIGALVCGLMVALALRAAGQRLKAAPRAGKLAWLGAAFAAGAAGLLLGLMPPPALPMLHLLDISTLSAGETNSGPVVFIELRDNAGDPVLPVDIQMEGAWQRGEEGWVARSDQPARLHYAFYGPPSGKLQVLFGEQPDGGAVQVELNGQIQKVDLSSPSRGQRLVELPFHKPSRWEKPIFVADLVLVGLALPLFLFIAPFYAAGAARWTGRAAWPAVRGIFASLDGSKVFIAAFVGLCLLPLLDYRGDWKNLDTFFIQGNRFWSMYSQARLKIFGDRFIGGSLVGSDGWLVLANDFSMEDYQNTVPLTSEELYQIQQRIDGAARYYEKRGITLLVVIPPNKNTIYPDRVPAQIQVIGAQSRLDQLLEYQRAHGEAQILDLRPALIEARKEHEVYYRTDTHWNHYGAHAGYVAIMGALQRQRPDLPGFTPHALAEYRYTQDDDGVGDMGRRWVNGIPAEPFFSLKPLYDRQLQKFESSQDRVLYVHTYNINGEGFPDAIVFHDSYMDWLGPYLADHFHRATFVRALDVGKGMDERLIAAEKPDIVIYECNERMLGSLATFTTHLASTEK